MTPGFSFQFLIANELCKPRPCPVLIISGNSMIDLWPYAIRHYTDHGRGEEIEL